MSRYPLDLELIRVSAFSDIRIDRVVCKCCIYQIGPLRLLLFDIQSKPQDSSFQSIIEIFDSLFIAISFTMESVICHVGHVIPPATDS